MARPLRIEYENAFYHITSRGNARNRIYHDDYDRDMFIEILADVVHKCEIVIHAFVLMGNHYHLLVETPQANLSASMRHLNGVYTQAHHRRHKTVGHVLQGRFKAIVVDKDAYYLELIRYIHLNPVRANVVKNLDDFNYSSHKAITDVVWGKRWRSWYDRNLILRNFGQRERTALAKYQDFIDAGRDVEDPLKKTIGGYALGDDTFADWLWTEFVEGRELRDTARKDSLKAKLSATAVAKAVSHEFSSKHSDVFRSKRGTVGSNEMRGMALYILDRHSGMTQREIGEAIGGMKSTTVSATVRRFKQSLNEEKRLKLTYRKIMRSLKT